MASSKLLKFAFGIIRSKLSAVFLGTEGVGIISQIQFTNLQFQKFTLLGMPDGLVKQIASSKASENFRSKLINSLKSYIIIVTFTTIIALALLMYLSDELTYYFYGDKKYLAYYYISIISLPVLIINSISYALLKAFKAVKYIANAEIISNISSFLLFVPAVFFYGLTGAVIVLLLNLIINLIINQANSTKHVLQPLKISLLDIQKGILVRKDIKELFTFAGFGLTIGIYQLATDIFCRSFVVNRLGIKSIGVYSPIQSWESFLTGMLLPTIFTYLYPRFAEAETNNEIVNILNDVFRLISFLMIPFLIVGIAFRKLLIPLFYNYEFSAAASYLPGHFLGTMFTMWMFSFSQVFTPTGRINIYVFFMFLQYSLNVIVVYSFVPIWGLTGWMLKFLIPPMIFYFIFYYYLSKNIGFYFIKDNRFLMIYCLSSSLILYGVSEFSNVIGMTTAIIFACFSWFFLRATEKEFIFKKSKLLLTKIKH